MAFIRTSTVALTREEAEEFKPGKLVYNALIPARKFIAQTCNGLIQTAVWRTTNTTGRIILTIFTEWATMEDLHAYANQPTIKELERQLASETEPVNVVVYENIG